jgi:hypothetical protein
MLKLRSDSAVETGVVTTVSVIFCFSETVFQISLVNSKDHRHVGRYVISIN